MGWLKTVLELIPLVGQILLYFEKKKEEKALAAVMLGVQKFGKSDEGKKKWNVIKSTIGEVAVALGVDKRVQRVKEKLESRAKRWEEKLVSKLFGD